MADTITTHRDPVCGMTVNPAKAAGSSEYRGQTYYFCGKGCLAKFTAEPGRYLRPPDVQPLVMVAPLPPKQNAQPVDALRQWMRSIVKFVATKKGMSAALALAAYKNSELFSYSFDRLTRAVRELLGRAIATGKIRDDISPEDLLRALVGMCYMHDQPDWQTSVLRLVDVFIDGLRIRPDGPRSKTKQRKSQ